MLPLQLQLVQLNAQHLLGAEVELLQQQLLHGPHLCKLLFRLGKGGFLCYQRRHTHKKESGGGDARQALFITPRQAGEAS